MGNLLEYHKWLLPLAVGDALTLTAIDTQYRGSWQARGGVGAFFTMIRSMDRLQAQVERHNWDIFRALQRTLDEPEGIANSLRDARRYLLLIEAAQMEQGELAPDTVRNIVARDAEFDRNSIWEFPLPGSVARSLILTPRTASE